MKIAFPDGTAVQALSLRDRKESNPQRDFGLYMDPRWEPTWPAELIEWEDFGLPADGERAAAQIRAAFERARAGERVEIGCAGGLGRTGTVLACMAILAGLPRDEAVKWVRAKYDPRAVETVEQQDWVRSFGS